MTSRYPKPDLLTQVPPRGHVIIEASAGTGKTYTLEHLVIDLLLRHPEVELDNILVVTFTERATIELKTRIRRLLQRVLSVTRSSGEEQQVLLPSTSEEGAYWELGEPERRKLERALFSFDVAPIYTIHGFCQRVLTEYAFANRRFFDQQHVEFGPLFERAFTDAMRRGLACDDELRGWLEAWLEVGSVEELQNMLAKCLLARAELWPRLREARLMEGLRTHGDNFWESYRELYTRRCDKRERAFLRAQRSWRETRNPARFLMYADSQVVELKQSLHRAEPETPEQRSFMDFAGSLLRFKPAVAQKFLPIIDEALATEKRRSGVYTFDDMLSMVWDSLERPGTGEWLAQTLRRRYKFALIDEFQDTDEIQWNIFRRLFVEAENGERLFVIGDPKQAIYGFRNADVYTYLEACQELLDEEELPDEAVNDDHHVLEELGASTSSEDEVDAGEELPEEEDDASAVKLVLQQNFRSTDTLIRAYNHILDQEDPEAFFTHDHIRYTHPVSCGNPDLVLHDAQGEKLSPVVLGAMKMRDGESKAVRMDDLYECYGRWIAVEIKRILSDEGALYFGDEGETRALTASDIYVLTRTRSDEIKLEKYLRAEQIPYVFIRQDGLFQTSEARDLYDLLRAIEKPRDRGRRLRAWATPFFAVELDDLVRCREIPETHKLFKMLLEWHQLAMQQRFERLFTEILQRSGLSRREIFFGEDERALTNYSHALEVLLEEAHLGRCDFGELVARCRAFIELKRKPLGQDGELKRLDDSRDAVQILTMHKSKGLEAPVVFLYSFGGMGGEFWRFHYKTRAGEMTRAMHILKPEEKISPRLRQRVEQEDKEESQRLLYVALTRAKARLYLPFVPYAGRQPICKYLAQRSYHVLNWKLKQVWEDAKEGELAGLFETYDIPYFGLAPSVETIGENELEAISSWEPAGELLSPAPVKSRAQYDDAALGRKRIESYSSLKRRAGGYRLVDVPTDGIGAQVETEVVPAEDAVSEDELPGGVRTGLFLHEILEVLDYSTLERYPTQSEWSQAPEVIQTFERLMLEHGLEPRYLELCFGVIWRALTTPVASEFGVIEGLGHCNPHISELEFMFPIPEASHPRLSEVVEGPVKVERGFIKGFIDYTFEHGGRVYFADWKSDLLERYDQPHLVPHFQANYSKQAYLYGIALCKMFGISDQASYEERFGGAVYCFLRGLQPGTSSGLVCYRPHWQQLCDFERALTEPEYGQARAQQPSWVTG